MPLRGRFLVYKSEDCIPLAYCLMYVMRATASRRKALKPLCHDRTSRLTSVSLHLSCTHIIPFLFLIQTPILLIPNSILLAFISFHHSLQSAPSFGTANRPNDSVTRPAVIALKRTQEIWTFC